MVTSHPQIIFAVIIIWTNNIPIPYFKLGEVEDIKKAFPSFHLAHHTVSRYGTIIRLGLATPQWLVQSLVLQVHSSKISAGGKQQLPQGSWTLLKIIAYADYTQVSEAVTSPSTNETLGEKRSNNKLPKHILVWGRGLFLWRTSCFAACDNTALVGGEVMLCSFLGTLGGPPSCDILHHCLWSVPYHAPASQIVDPILISSTVYLLYLTKRYSGDNRLTLLSNLYKV